MNDIQNNINKILNSINDNSELITNVKNLEKDIQEIENSIKEETSKSYNEIVSGINNLKLLVSNTTSEMENSKDNENKELDSLNNDYFSILVNMKNELMNFDIKNFDSLIESFDEYNNQKKEIFTELSSIVTSYSSEVLSLNKILPELIIESFINTKNIYIDFQEKLSLSFESIKNRINEIYSYFNYLYSTYHDNIDQLSLKNKENKEKINNRYPDIHALLSSGCFRKQFDESYIKSINELIDEYATKQNNLIESFKEESNSCITRIEKILFHEQQLPKTNKDNKNRLLKDLLELSEMTDDKMLEIEKIYDDNDIDEVITLVYKNISSSSYDNFVKSSKDLELHYNSELTKILNQRSFIYHLSENNTPYSILENELNRNNALKEYYQIYSLLVNNKMDLSFHFMINEVKLLSALNTVYASYKHETELINLSLKKAIKDDLIHLRSKISILKSKNIFNNKMSKDLYINLKRRGEKTLALLNYGILSADLHRNYTTSKAIVKIGYSLFQKERDINLLPIQYSLKRIIDSYDVYKNTYDNLYKTEVKLLSSSKLRHELSELSNLKYIESFLQHQSISISQILDANENEYQMRLHFINDIKNESNSFSETEINRISTIYLEQIEKITKIKNIELSSVLTMIDNFKLNGNESKDLYVEKVNEIFVKFDEINNKLISLLNDDDEILYHKEYSNIVDNIALSSFSNANILRNETIKSAFESMKIAETNFNNLIDSMNKNSKIDFDKILKEYTNNHTISLNKLNERLDSDTKIPLEQLNELYLYYSSDSYNKQFEELKQTHIEKSKELYNNLIKEYNEIDNKYQNDPLLFEDLSNELFNSINKINNDANHLLSSNMKLFNSNKDKLHKAYISSVSNISINSVSNINKISKELKEEKNIINEDLNSLTNIAEDNINIISKLLKKARYNYELEYKAFKTDLDNKLKFLLKDIKSKYKNITIKELTNKKS